MGEYLNKEIVLVMDLLRRSIESEGRDGSSSVYDSNQYDLKKVYSMLQKNNLIGITSPMIGLFSDNGVDEVLNAWRDTAKWQLIREYNKYIGLREIVKAGNEKDVDLVIFKGPVIADLYPQYALRYSADTDIFVEEGKFEMTLELLNDIGYKSKKDDAKEEVPVLVNEKYSSVVELHKYLWEDYTGPRIEILKKLNLTDKSKMIKVNVCGIDMLTLSHEDHLVYQMFHIIKHFSTQAVGIRYLSDITLFINAYGEFVDYKEFWRKMKLLEFDGFTIVFLSLCVKYLGMNATVLEGIPDVDTESEDLLLFDMITKGVLYETKSAAWQILGIMTPYLVGNEHISESKWKRLFKVMFPAPKALPDNYSYAKKFVLLLPFAWFHKGINYLVGYWKVKRTYGDWYNANEKLAMAEYRLGLMKKYGLAKEYK